MPEFEPLLDESARKRAPSDDSALGMSSDFHRRSPVLSPELAASNRTQDHGGGAVDQDLGRSLYSTPRLETMSKKYWQDDDAFDDSHDGQAREAKPNRGFISEYSSLAKEAFGAGAGAGRDAEGYRARFADIRRQRRGGFLNYNNWGWVRRRRENRLRSEIAAQYGSPRAAQAPAADPIEAPQRAAMSQEIAAPPMSTHRTAVPGRSILKGGISRIHDDTTVNPELATAQANQAAAFAEEVPASAPFGSEGALRGKLDVRMAGGTKSKAKIFGQASAPHAGALLYGNPTAVPSPPSQAEADQASDYAGKMQTSYDAERLVRAHTTEQHLRDQGEAAMPTLKSELRPFRAAFFNGYWGSESANPKPTRVANTANRVQFDESADQVPYDERDPEREFALKSAAKHEREAPRKSAFKARKQEFRDTYQARWGQISDLGAQVHGEEPGLQAAPEASGAGLIEEE